MEAKEDVKNAYHVSNIFFWPLLFMSEINCINL